MGEPSRLRLEHVDLDALMQRTITRWHPTAQRNWSLDSQAGAIVADADRLEAALDSLLDNAVRYTNEGGTIALSARRVDGHAVIRDDGIGIPDEDLAYVFESFRSGSVRAGTGMGLVIVAAVAHLHGGSVHAENPHTGGAQFTLQLPTGLRNARLVPTAAGAG